ncbi:MAG: DUF4445 domain-containing protein [Candidatus Hydrogenedentes bacterium]|nr:DUF4445 domain-containing protein [Candidatus Hydrogenedentota bacterium]
MDERFETVRFLPEETTVSVPHGHSLLAAAALAGITLDAPCGGIGNCGKCKVQPMGETPVWGDAERALLSHAEQAEGFRLACQTPVRSALTVHIPYSSRLATAHQILVDTATAKAPDATPVLRVIPFHLEPPTLEDSTADCERIQAALGPLHVPLGLIRALPARLRSGSFHGAAIVSGERLLDVVEGHATAPCFAAAFDIGTTTLAATLIDPRDGRERARAARLNPQCAVGDDVVTRISHASAAPAQREALRSGIVRAVNEMIAELAAAAGVSTEHIYELVFTGNTVMQQLLLGIDPAPLGVSPFVPAIGGPMEMAAAGAGFKAHPNARCHVFPVIAAYAGGDTVAGILATRLAGMESPALFIDIGTNGELVLAKDGNLVATSCAAGPAFEGVRIRDGMRAANGAIEAIRLEDDVACKIIGGGRPAGMCGSALVDIVAELLRLKVLSCSGYFAAPQDLPQDLPPALRARLRPLDGQPAFAVATQDETATGRPIALYQSDVREVQLATAAVRAALQILLSRTGTQPTDLRQVIVAGGFGNYLRCANAQRMGLLPPEVCPGRIAFAGNTALAGARLAATSQTARNAAEELARRTTHIDLSLDPAFQDTYIEALFFP